VTEGMLDEAMKAYDKRERRFKDLDAAVTTRETLVTGGGAWHQIEVRYCEADGYEPFYELVIDGAVTPLKVGEAEMIVEAILGEPGEVPE
jgi:hypothetical protein